jgi:hypothetical protein
MLWFRIDGANRDDACAYADCEVCVSGTTFVVSMGFVGESDSGMAEGGHILGRFNGETEVVVLFIFLYKTRARPLVRIAHPNRKGCMSLCLIFSLAHNPAATAYLRST